MREYYSNCIIEGIKAKIKKRVKLLWVSPFDNEVFCPHLFWTDGEYEYDFWATSDTRLRWYQLLWHKGIIRVNEMGHRDESVDTLKRWKARRDSM